MNHLPEPPAAPAAGQATPSDTDRATAARLLAALDELPTSYRDDTPLPRYGSAPPVPQPGIPPQSKPAVDYAVRVLSTGVATALGSGGLALVLAATQAADPVVCGIVFGAPIGLTAPIAALSSLAKRWKQAAPAPTINNYNGTVHQQTTHSRNTGLWARTDNQQ